MHDQHLYDWIHHSVAVKRWNKFTLKSYKGAPKNVGEIRPRINIWLILDMWINTIERQGAFNFQAGHFRSLSHGQALNQGFIPARLNFLTGAAEIALPQQNRQSHGDQPPNSQAEHDFVIDFGGDTGATVNTATTHDTNNNGHRTREQNPINSLRSLWKASEGSLPFIFLLLIKILYDHRLGKGYFHYLSLLV